MRHAEDLEVDEYRGILYPALLSVADRCHPYRSFLLPIAAWEKEPCPDLAGLQVLQVLQVVLGAASLAYLLYVFTERRTEGGPTPRRSLWVGALLVALLLFDPLVAHFNLSIMTDGLALSGSVLFCAALVDIARRRSPLWVSGFLLLVSTFATAGLRVEKRWILLGTALLAVAWWSWLAWRSRAPAPVSLGRRALIVLIVLTSLGTITGLQRSVEKNYGRWPLHISLLHQRIVFPHLRSVRKELPERSRVLLKFKDARDADSELNESRRVVRRITRSPRVRDQFILDAAAIAWRKHKGEILLDIVADGVENVFATPSYYLRLLVWATAGDEAFEHGSASGGTRWTYQNLAHHHPRLSLAHTLLAAFLFLATLALAIRALVRRRREGVAWLGESPSTLLLPPLLFCLLNAAAFAVTQDLVHVRYAMIAHLMGLFLLYRLALEIIRPSALRASPREPRADRAGR
jgi:hypothetical protein